MNIIDILILILLFIYIAKGFKNGAIKEFVSFVGGIIVIVIAYLLKNPVSVFLYEHLPFFKFNGLLSGISVINIIVYELIAFLAVASILLIIYKLVLGVTNILETILKVTIILEIPSKIIGLVVGFVEGIVVVFVLLFILLQFNYTREYIDNSKYGHLILQNTPVLSSATNSIYSSLQEIYDLTEEYKDSTDRNSVNLQALDILLKYKVISAENANVLISTGKLNIIGADEVISKY